MKTKFGPVVVSLALLALPFATLAESKRAPETRGTVQQFADFLKSSSPALLAALDKGYEREIAFSMDCVHLRRMNDMKVFVSTTGAIYTAGIFAAAFIVPAAPAIGTVLTLSLEGAVAFSGLGYGAATTEGQKAATVCGPLLLQHEMVKQARAQKNAELGKTATDTRLLSYPVKRRKQPSPETFSSLPALPSQGVGSAR